MAGAPSGEHGTTPSSLHTPCHRQITPDAPLGSVCKGVVPFAHEPTTTTRTDRRPVAATRVVAAPATPVHRATGQEAAAKATAAAEVARAKAEQARQRAEQERQDANQRYLDVLVTEHESARTAAVTALGEAREALAVAVKVATERFAGAFGRVGRDRLSPGDRRL